MTDDVPWFTGAFHMRVGYDPNVRIKSGEGEEMTMTTEERRADKLCPECGRTYHYTVQDTHCMACGTELTRRE